MALASDTAYGAMKAWIQASVLPPGGLIDEADVARKLGMSRTPVREALLRLQSEGYVKVSRGRGIRILPLSSSDLREIYQVISGLEVTAVTLLSARRPARADLVSLATITQNMREAIERDDIDGWGETDEQFHRELMLLSGNRKLLAVGIQMRDFVKRAHMVAVRLQTPEYRLGSICNHETLVELLTGKDPNAAREMHHLQRLRGETALVGMVEHFNLAAL